jgi:catechol 2,3-dioxygenase-like lactoylglutathione lyase family enzyme
MPALVALVLRCADVDTTAAFYRALGIELVEEQHGTGPRHLSG